MENVAYTLLPIRASCTYALNVLTKSHGSREIFCHYIFLVIITNKNIITTAVSNLRCRDDSFPFPKYAKSNCCVTLSLHRVASLIAWDSTAITCFYFRENNFRTIFSPPKSFTMLRSQCTIIQQLDVGLDPSRRLLKIKCGTYGQFMVLVSCQRTVNVTRGKFNKSLYEMLVGNQSINSVGARSKFNHGAFDFIQLIFGHDC